VVSAPGPLPGARSRTIAALACARGHRTRPVRRNRRQISAVNPLVTHGTLAQIAEDFRQIGGLVGAYHVNVTDIIARLRARAREIGVDLSSPFFFAPDDPRLNDVLRQVEQERDARIARFRRDKRKLGAIVARRRSKDIEVVPRVRAIEYPFAVGGRG
jgi:hypothetical protein